MNEIKPTQSIGVPQPLVDGPEKVSGKALYSSDFIPNNCLVGRIFRSPVAHAEIIKLDISAAEALPGVHGIITGEDCDEPYGVLPIARFEYPMARDKVRYRGEPLACVAAEDVETAQKAIDLIKFEYKELPAYFTSSDAMSEGAIDLHDHRPGNIEREVDYEIGDVNAALVNIAAIIGANISIITS